ncbi:ATP-binding protein [Leptodesmis sichuanensis]|uniref:ATP-binding protein n=1 Tax=Leptodesmis sichuanensis TaxID=2906798 RepID=UPI001F274D93|nr:ATP-binding protein [Leptodesmis sichuanensis]UIE38914.1 ATP-binding protein [Leptodesmis sichuanensis A121]
MVLQNLFKEYPPRSPSDFVGREVELKQFQRILNRLSREPGCFIVNIFGQAGVGKTELLRQYRKRLDTAEVLWALTAETEPDGVPSGKNG